MRKRLVPLVMLGVAAVAVTAPATASARAVASVTSLASSDAHTLDLTGVMTGVRVALDAAPRGQSAGDISFITGRLFDNGEDAGRYHGACSQITTTTSQCTFTLGTHRGQIVLLASYGPGYNTGSTAHEAIIGGTRAYQGAHGQAITTETGATHIKMHLEFVN